MYYIAREDSMLGLLTIAGSKHILSRANMKDPKDCN